MNLIQAWLHWFSGNKLDENTTVCAVLCWKLLVWARWGKVIQLVSATAIIADIIGPEKLRETGKSLRKVFSINLSKKHLSKTMGWLRDIYQPILKAIEISTKEPEILNQKMDELHSEWLSGKISNEEYQKKLFSRSASEQIDDPFIMMKQFIAWMGRIFRRSLLDKFNFFSSLVILIACWVPLAEKVYLIYVQLFIDSSFGLRKPWEAYLTALPFPLFFLLFGFLANLFFNKSYSCFSTHSCVYSFCVNY
jgi:hypothetical protein